ncbi:MAG TPA: hypothetical protein VFC46_12255, partial [Humisphaera sp.]|nr:hypothetical protein [Humisphaera sp.]
GPIPDIAVPEPPNVRRVERFILDGEMAASDRQPVYSTGDLASYRTDPADNVFVIHVDGTEEPVSIIPIKRRDETPRRWRRSLNVKPETILAGVGGGIGVIFFIYYSFFLP